jgi:MFS family permease
MDIQCICNCIWRFVASWWLPIRYLKTKKNLHNWLHNTHNHISCCWANSGVILIVARALQGLGAALIAPSALSMVVSLFGSNKSEMNKAMGIWGASAPAGRTAGVFLGGIITVWLDWPWVFLINVPVGIAVLALTRKLLHRAIKRKGSVHYLGAV